MEIPVERKRLAFLLAVSFLVRVGFVLTLQDRLHFDDEFEYRKMAENFLAGGGLMPGETMKAFRPPLYPLLLAAVLRMFGFSLTGIRILQALFSTVTVVLIWLLGERLFSKRVAWISGWVSAVYPFFVFYSGFLLTETLFVFLVVLSVFLVMEIPKGGRATSLAAGAAIGLSGLCRPTMQIYVIPVTALVLLSAKRFGVGFRKAVFLALGFLLLLAPWVIRNYRVLHRFVPGTTMSGRVFWEGNNPRSSGGPCRYFLPEIESLEEGERDRAYYRATFDGIRRNPRRFLGLLGAKFVRFWNIVPNAAEYARPLYRLISISSFGLLLPFFVLGFLLTLRDRSLWPIHALILMFTAVHVVLLASIRYRVPLEPFVILLAVVGFLYLADAVTQPRTCPRDQPPGLAREKGGWR